MDLNLKGARALITGGTKGIGRAIAETFADEGCNVGICARNAEEVDAAVAELSAKGVTAFGQAVDVGDGEAFKAWIDASAMSIVPGMAPGSSPSPVSGLYCFRLPHASLASCQASSSAAASAQTALLMIS